MSGSIIRAEEPRSDTGYGTVRTDMPMSGDLPGGPSPGSLTQSPSPKRLSGLKMLISGSWASR